MKTIMNDTQIKTLEQVRQFLNGTGAIDLVIETKEARYDWIRDTLIRFGYRQLGKADKGLLLNFLHKVSGYSRIQIKRLVKQYLKTGRLQRRQRTVKGFTRKYIPEDIRLLAHTDELHGTLSGPATKKLCERAWERFGQTEYHRLADISVGHLYNLRRSTTYRGVRHHFEKTRSTVSSIGERRQPQPDGKPGYLRVDTVHQGDLDGVKGVYHVNAVDEVTQFEIVCSVEKISERYLLPVLEAQLEQFPFVILAFHADNGSEYINKHVAQLLNKLLIELTKSRPRHSNDNALVESKNGAIVRKHLGYVHIPQKWAPLINAFNRNHLNPYINFHRPCFFPVVITDAKGKQRKTYPYPAMMPPYDKFKSLPNAEQYLKPEITLKQLDDIATASSDNDAAKQLNEAKLKLYKTIFEQKYRAA
ncbi:MAG: transposase family protein [Ketobacter sp.]|nr:transposase family protein [Ketobacter sp.]